MKIRRMAVNIAASVLAALTLIPFASAQTPATRKFTAPFEVTIRRANVQQAPYTVLGELSMNVAADGSFDCEITPYKGIAEMPNPPSVIVVNGKFDPDAPAKLSCSGQVSGRLIGLTIDMGNGYKIFGTGVMPSDLSKMAPGAITETFGGTASTTVPGESGDWVVVCVTVTVRIGTLTIEATVCRNVPFL